jgi:N-formylglutamate deformylase
MQHDTETRVLDEKADRRFALLRAKPYVVHKPQSQVVPFVFSSPHSGRIYPVTFIKSSRLGRTCLRRSEDAFIDELFASALDVGAPLIAARFPRALIDANRAPTELDPSMFEGELLLPVDSASPRVNAGLGVIPRIVRQGAEIYHQKVSAEVAAERLTDFYLPYHAALRRLVSETRSAFGTTILIDCHSMPSAAAGPDIVLGDRHGESASPLVILAAERAFQAQGFRVVRNVPYAGGYTTQLHGQPKYGVHALQVEINRALYLDEESISRNASFRLVSAGIAAALAKLVGLCAAFCRGPAALDHAAE